MKNTRKRTVFTKMKPGEIKQRLEFAARKTPQKNGVWLIGTSKKHAPQGRLVMLLQKGIVHPNAFVREFYYALIMEAKIPKKQFSSMRDLSSGLRDPAKYVRFHSACALAEHGAGKYKREVLRILKLFKTDEFPSARALAKHYLERKETKA